MKLYDAYKKKYPQRVKRVSELYEQANDCKFEFSELTKLRLQNFVDYMTETIAASSARQYAAQLKAVLNLYSEEVELPKDYEKILSLRNQKCTCTWLNDFDIERLCNYVPETTTERLVLQQFIVGCYSGARHSDYIHMDKTNIVDGMLMYVSQKTHIQATVPVKPIVERLLNEVVRKEVNDYTFNETIRAICCKCGITERVKLFKAGKQVEGEKWRFISSHSARKSFATNLYLRGADLYSISKMMGHASVTQTEGYICCGLRQLPNEVLDYFK